MSKHASVMESFIYNVFKGFLALIIALMLLSGYGLVVMSAPVFLAITLSLLVAGVGLYIFSDYKMRTMGSMEDAIPQNTEEEREDTQGLDVMMVSIIGTELAVIMTKNNALNDILTQQWWMPIVLAAGIFTYYVFATIIFHLRLFSRNEDKEKVDQYYDKMAKAHKVFMYNLCSVLPQIIITALVMNTVAMKLLASSIIVAGPLGLAICCIGLCITLYVNTVQKNLKTMQNEGNKKFRLHENYFSMNDYVKKLLVKLIVGLLLSTLAGYLLLNAPYLMAHSMVVFTVLAGILLVSMVYNTYQKNIQYQKDFSREFSYHKKAEEAPACLHQKSDHMPYAKNNTCAVSDEKQYDASLEEKNNNEADRKPTLP